MIENDRWVSYPRQESIHEISKAKAVRVAYGHSMRDCVLQEESVTTSGHSRRTEAAPSIMSHEKNAKPSLARACVGTWIIDGDELALTIGMVSVLSS